MGLRGTNVDHLRDTIYRNGFIRHNRFEIDYFPNISGINLNGRSGVPAFAVKIPGWDTTTTTETNVYGPNDWGSPKIMPIRKNWNQALFITFYMENHHAENQSILDEMFAWNNAVVKGGGPQPFYNERIFNSNLTIRVGENAHRLEWKFWEVWPRVLYPIDLKPVEDFAPFIFSIQFIYRYFELIADGTVIG